MKKTRRRYDRDFKISVLAELEAGKPLAQIAREYGIHPSLPCRWKAEPAENPEKAFRGNGNKYKDQAKIAELERLLDQAHAEIELSKNLHDSVNHTRSMRNAKRGSARSWRCCWRERHDFARVTHCLENRKIVFVQILSSDDTIAIGSTEFIVLRSKTLIPELVYLIARSESFRDHAIKNMSGATGRQRVRENCFDSFLIAQPGLKILGELHDILSPFFKNIHFLSCKNSILSCTCSLLPKLNLGEIGVD
jgi:transposase